MMRSLALLLIENGDSPCCTGCKEYSNDTLESGQKSNDINSILLRKKQTKFGKSYGESGVPARITCEKSATLLITNQRNASQLRHGGRAPQKKLSKPKAAW
jgi:hypothetical protein